LFTSDSKEIRTGEIPYAIVRQFGLIMSRDRQHEGFAPTASDLSATNANFMKPAISLSSCRSPALRRSAHPLVAARRTAPAQDITRPGETDDARSPRAGRIESL
jgi:hypothetical protein